MPAKKVKTTTVEKGQYRIYLKKAGEFYETMLQAQGVNNWNAVGLNAVHCAISSVDALLVFYIGKRSTDDTHRSVVGLVSSSIDLPEIKSKVETLKKILDKKSLVAYEDRDFTQGDALEIAKLTERFFSWVKSILPKG